MQIAQDYDSVDCILDMVLSPTQVMPQNTWYEKKIEVLQGTGMLKAGKGL